MRHKLIIAVMLVPMMILLSGCESREKYAETIHDRIHENFSSIKSYTAQCTVTVHTQKDNVYNVKMSYDKDTNTYRLAYDDIGISISNETAEITKGDRKLKSRSSNSYMPMFINNFFRRYYNGENATADVSNIKNFGTTTLEVQLSDNDKNASFEKLWIDNKTALPLKADICKQDGSIYMEIIYKDFKFN